MLLRIQGKEIMYDAGKEKISERTQSLGGQVLMRSNSHVEQKEGNMGKAECMSTVQKDW